MPIPKPRSDLLLNGLQTLAIVVGLVYGGIQVQQFRGEQQRQANIELARSFMTPEFNEAMAGVLTMPPDITEADMIERAPRLLLLMQTLEIVGVLVNQGDLDLRVADEFMGSGIVMAWERLRPFVEQYRAQMGNPHVFEWFQWLAEQVVAYDRGHPRRPAYEAQRDWQMPD
jgi:hypothetical protein